MTTFKIGDKVKILHKIIKEDGWYNIWWSGGMDKYVANGQTYTVVSVDQGGIYLKEIDSGWPKGSLVLAEEVIPDGLTPVQRRCKKLWNESNWVKQHPNLVY